MKDITFKALAVTNEIDLNKIAIHCGIPKKYTWEQPLILRGDILSSILQKEIGALQQVLVFSFGSVVFVNHANRDEITVFLKFSNHLSQILSFNMQTDIWTITVFISRKSKAWS